MNKRSKVSTSRSTRSGLTTCSRGAIRRARVRIVKNRQRHLELLDVLRDVGRRRAGIRVDADDLETLLLVLMSQTGHLLQVQVGDGAALAHEEDDHHRLVAVVRERHLLATRIRQDELGHLAASELRLAGRRCRIAQVELGALGPARGGEAYASADAAR